MLEQQYFTQVVCPPCRSIVWVFIQPKLTAAFAADTSTLHKCVRTGAFLNRHFNWNISDAESRKRNKTMHDVIPNAFTPKTKRNNFLMALISTIKMNIKFETMMHIKFKQLTYLYMETFRVNKMEFAHKWFHKKYLFRVIWTFFQLIFIWKIILKWLNFKKIKRISFHNSEIKCIGIMIHMHISIAIFNILTLLVKIPFCYWNMMRKKIWLHWNNKKVKNSNRACKNLHTSIIRQTFIK